MAEVLKQDSNFTELRYAVEETPGVLPGSPIWYPLEPNDYKDFGGEVVTKARRPINASRQRKKGVVVDLDAAGGFSQDVTATNLQDIMQTFMFAELRTKGELSVPAVDGTGNDYEPASGGAVYQAGDLLFAKGFDESSNNGLKIVTTGGTGTSVPVTDTALVDETGASGIISRVGYKFAQGIASINAIASNFPRLEVANVAASGDLVTDNTNAIDASSVTIGATDYLFQDTLTAGSAGEVHVKIGADADATLLNLARAINNSGGTAGVDYSTTGTGANPDVTSSASVTSHTITLTAIVKGDIGNLIATTASTVPDSHIDPEGALLTGGVGRALTTLGLIPGEFVYIGGDDATTNGDSFNLATSNGFCRMREITSDYIAFDKTESVMVDDNGSGKNVKLFFGRVLKNENTRALIVKRPVQLERALGAPDDSDLTEVQAEYITRAYGDEAVLDMKTAEIVTMDMKFMGGTHETVDGSSVPMKTGARPNIEESDAFNSTSDVSVFKMAIVEDGDASPEPLFAYLTDFKVAIKNNLKQNKAVSVLGAFDITPGIFEVSAEVSAYFTKVSSIEAVKSNEDVTLELHMAKHNKGVTVDLPLVALGKARADIKLDEPIMLPMSVDAATAVSIDEDLDYTMMWVFWDYLPDAAQ